MPNVDRASIFVLYPTFVLYFGECPILSYICLNNLKRDPLETQHPKFENSRLGVIEIMVDATSLTPPSPGLSVTLFPNKC